MRTFNRHSGLHNDIMPLFEIPTPIHHSAAGLGCQRQQYQQVAPLNEGSRFKLTRGLFAPTFCVLCADGVELLV